MKEMNILEKIIDWADQRNILAQGTFSGQFLKCIEELEKVDEAYSNFLKQEPLSKECFKAMDALKTELGDVLVTLILLCDFAGSDTIECLELAYEKIKDRKGKMVDGQFVKEE